MLHVAFVIILVGSLGARERAGDVLSERGSHEPAVISVARSQAFIRSQIRNPAFANAARQASLVEVCDPLGIDRLKLAALFCEPRRLTPAR